MLRVAIVDDLPAECEALRILLEDFAAAKRQTASITEFHTASSLLEKYRPGAYDIVFLDIFLEAENGVDCALTLREQDADVNLIFLTTSPEFGVKSYDVRAADYILKPATPEKLSRALRYCTFHQLQEGPSLTVSSRHQSLDIALDRILYADFQDRTPQIHLADCAVPVSGTFTELSRRLTEFPAFMACFKGVVVNLKKVQEVSGDFLVLDTGERLPVSRRLQKQVQQRRLRLSAGSLRGECL